MSDLDTKLNSVYAPLTFLERGLVVLVGVAWCSAGGLQVGGIGGTRHTQTHDDAWPAGGRGQGVISMRTQGRALPN